MRRALGGLAVIALMSCAVESERELGPCGEQRCSVQCEAFAEGPCDVLKRSCRERILGAVRCVRGTEGELPEVRVISREDYESEVLGPDMALDGGVADTTGDAGAQDAGEPGLEPELTIDAWSRALQLMHLLDPDRSLREASAQDTVEFVAGTYDSDERIITLIDDGQESSSAGSVTLFAHELVHALQDQQVGLEEWTARFTGTPDSVAARRCLTEGEATLYAELAWSLLNDLPADPEYIALKLTRALKWSRRDAVRAESPATSTRHLVYAVGGGYLLDAWLAGGPAAVERVYRSPPLSTVEYLEGYGRREGKPVILALGCSRAGLATGFERTYQVSMGALTVFAFLGHVLTEDGVYATAELWRDAELWRNDELTVFTVDGETSLPLDAPVAASWRMRFADAGTAERLSRALSRRLPDARVERHDDELEVIATSSRELLADWPATDPDACPDE